MFIKYMLSNLSIYVGILAYIKTYTHYIFWNINISISYHIVQANAEPGIPYKRFWILLKCQ